MLPQQPVCRGLSVAYASAFMLVAAALPAQSGPGKPDIPSKYMPPPGLCRIWVEGVPPGKQPAPTDCTKALRNKPTNATVVFGDAKAADAKSGEAKAPPVTGNPKTTKAQRDSTTAKRGTIPPKRDTIPSTAGPHAR